MFTCHLSVVTSWSCTWTEVVEVVVSSIREVPGEGARVNLGWGGGTGAQRKPPMKQVLLLHPDNLLVLCRGEKAQHRERRCKKKGSKNIGNEMKFQIFGFCACMHLPFSHSLFHWLKLHIPTPYSFSLSMSIHLSSPPFQLSPTLTKIYCMRTCKPVHIMALCMAVTSSSHCALSE